MRLSTDDFLHVLRSTPLVSIDLVVRDPAGRVLVGWRSNAPARGSWFVPGGRIYKGETVARAFARITTTELGRAVPQESARFLGVFDHLYDDNALDVPGVSTHYVVLAYALDAPPEGTTLAADQHTRTAWRSPADLCADPSVHANTRAYFAPAASPESSTP